MKTSKTRKVVKGWGALDMRAGYPRIFEVYNKGIGGYRSIANIFLDREEAEAYCRWTYIGRQMKIVPCTITYSLPTTKKKK